LKQSVKYGYSTISNEYLTILKETDKYFFMYHHLVKILMMIY